MMEVSDKSQVAEVSVEDILAVYSGVVCEISENQASAICKAGPAPTLQTVDRAKPYSCPMCPYRTHSRRNVSRHVKGVHENIKTFECPECNYRFSRKDGMNSHIRTVHQKIKPYACDVCSYRASRNSDLRIHVRDVHEVNKPFSCPICEYRCSKRDTLRIHVSSVHEGLKPFGCHLCDYKAGRKEHLGRHLKVVHGAGGNAYPCNFCEFKTGRRSELKAHLQSCHEKNITTYKCNFCDSSFRRKETLRCHVRTVHYGIMPFTCELCRLKCSRVIDLKRHMMEVHLTQVNLFICNECSDSFTTREALNNHINSVHGYKLYSCDMCEYKVSNGTEFKLHMSVSHALFDVRLDNYRTDIPLNSDVALIPTKPFSCDLCPFQTTKKKDLNNHKMLTHEVVQAFLCNHCDFVAKQKTDLISHKLATHRDMLEASELFELSQSIGIQATATNSVEVYELPHSIISGSQTLYDIAMKNLTDLPISNFANETAADKPEFPVLGDMSSRISVMIGNEEIGKSVVEPVGAACAFVEGGKVDAPILSDFPVRDGEEVVEEKSVGYNKEGKGKAMPFACSLCDYKANEKRYLARHLRDRHEEGKRYTCKLCGYGTNDKTSHTRHMKGVHENWKPYLCNMCDYRAQRSYHLKKHFRAIHERGESHRCDQCSYTTHLYNNLLRHMLKHDGSRPYSCQVCQFRFNRRDHLINHIAAKHDGGRTYSCDKCGLKSDSKEHISKHIRTLHKESIT